MKKKILTLILAMAFLMSFLPAIVWADGEPTLTDSAVLRLEAEDYQAQLAGTVVAEVSGYSGGKRLAFTDISGATNLDFSVNVQTAGKYRITVKWGTGSGNANSSIKINGVDAFSCPSGAWKNLATELEATFSAGINTVTVANTGWGKTLWVDYAEFEFVPQLEVLPAGGTLKLEAESYTGQTANNGNNQAWALSNGLRVPMTSEGITFRFDAEEAGTYELKVRWGEANATNTISIKVNDTAITPEFNTFTNYWSGVAYANVTLVQGENTVAITKNGNIWVDYIQINPVPTLTASSPLRLEAEDYHKGYGFKTRRFGNDAYIFNNEASKVTTFKAVMDVTTAGWYTMDLCAGGFSSAHPELTVNIDGNPVYTGTAAGSTSSTPSAITTYGTGVGITTSTVELTAGQHTVSVDLPAGSNALMDYISFTKCAPVKVTADGEVTVDDAITAADTSAFSGSATADAELLANKTNIYNVDGTPTLYEGTYKIAFGANDFSGVTTAPDKFGMALYCGDDFVGLYEAKSVIGNKWGILFYGLNSAKTYTMKPYVQYNGEAAIISQ